MRATFLSLAGAASLCGGGCAADPAPRMLTEGWQQLHANQPDRALATATNILSEFPRSPRRTEALYLKGRALEARTAPSELDQRKNLNAAASAYAEALQRNPNRALSGRLYAGLGNVSYWLEDYNAAWHNWATSYDLTEDATSKALILYRIGLCQQRLGRFAEADRTFAAVQQNFGATDAALRAKEKMGVRTFAVQVATFASAQNAENAINALRREGFMPQRIANARGQTVVTVSPFNDYQQAKAARERLAGLFPDALVVP